MLNQILRRSLAAASCVALLAGSAPALAEALYPGDTGANMLADLFIVRPLGVVGSVLGAAAFVVTLPFTLPTQSADKAARELVGKPFEYTLNRPLGDFDHCGAQRHACGNF
jgi:branched-subunit amino acid ABC-type transport system permease component